MRRRWIWSATSRKRIETVHPQLSRWALALLQHPALPYDLMIPQFGGARSEGEQGILVNAGRSRTRDSRHLRHPSDGLARAIDVVPLIGGAPKWEWGPMRQVAEVGFAVAFELGVPLVWGGNWPSFPDGAHWELSREVYP